MTRRGFRHDHRDDRASLRGPVGRVRELMRCCATWRSAQRGSRRRCDAQPAPKAEVVCSWLLRRRSGTLLGQPLSLPLGPGEPESGNEFRRLATLHTFGDSWARTDQLDTRTRSLISVAITAALSTHEPLRGQLRIALNNGVTKDDIVELFIHLEAYAGAARAFDSYQIATAVFAEHP
jgi:4-carboxymuconolactone decarboxylase